MGDASDLPAKAASARLRNRLDQWELRRTRVNEQQKSLAYERIKDTSAFGPLMRSAENIAMRQATSDEPPFIVANSMREVQPEINLLVSPDPQRLHWVAPASAPTWTAQAGAES